MKNMFTRVCSMALVAVMLLTSSPIAFAKGGGGGGGGGRSFSSPSSFGKPSGGSFFSSPKSAPAPSPAPAPAPVRQAPVATPAPAPVSPTPAVQPQKSFFAKDQTQAVGHDQRALEAQKHSDSQAAFKAAQDRKNVNVAPVAATNTTVKQMPTAKVYDISALRAAREQRVAELSAKMANNQYRQRDVRAQQMYGSYYNNSVQVPRYYGSGYNDSYSNPAFWYWLQNQNQMERDRFIYNHRSQIDPQRLQDMGSTYPELSARLNLLDESGVKSDANYVPTGLAGNEDLIYGDDVASAAKVKASESSVGWLWLFLALTVLVWATWYVLFGTKFKVKVKEDKYA